MVDENPPTEPIVEPQPTNLDGSPILPPAAPEPEPAGLATPAAVDENGALLNAEGRPLDTPETGPTLDENGVPVDGDGNPLPPAPPVEPAPGDEPDDYKDVVDEKPVEVGSVDPEPPYDAHKLYGSGGPQDGLSDELRQRLHDVGAKGYEDVEPPVDTAPPTGPSS